MQGPTRVQCVLKRGTDVFVAGLVLLLSWWLILLAAIIATSSTRQWGLFTQERIGRWGRPFRVVKIRTMRNEASRESTVTAGDDPRVTPFGRLLRRTKVDELPQMWSVLVGDMSLVGPRPDVRGFADQLIGPERIILSVRPGITGPATLAFRHEEEILARQPDPEGFNRDVLYPEKVRLNCEYLKRYSFREDLLCMALTLPLPVRVEEFLARRSNLDLEHRIA